MNDFRTVRLKNETCYRIKNGGWGEWGDSFDTVINKILDTIEGKKSVYPKSSSYAKLLEMEQKNDV